MEQVAREGSGMVAHRIRVRIAELQAYYDVQPLLAFFGLGFAMCFCYSSQRMSCNIVNGWFQIVQYCGMLATGVGFGAYGFARGKNSSRNRPVVAAMLALCVLVVPLIVIPGPWAAWGPLMLVLAALDGAVFTWLCLTWGTFYARLGVRQAFMCVCGFLVLSSAVKVFLDLLSHDVVGAVVLGALPFASCACLRIALRARPVQPPQERQYDRRTFGVLRSIAAGVFIVVTGVALCMSLTTGVFGLPFAARVASQAATIVLTLVALIAGSRLREPVSSFMLWYLVVLVIASSLALGVLFGAPLGYLSSAIFTTAQMLSIGFVWLSLSDVSHRCEVASDVVFGLGWGMLFAAPMALGLGLPRLFAALGTTTLDASSLAVVVLWLLLVALLFMRQRQSPELRLFAGFDPQVRGEVAATLSDRMGAIADAYGLTAREREVVELYAQGRSRAFISAQLVISENTVRDHIKSAYRKLGIHNKQELIDRIGS